MQADFHFGEGAGGGEGRVGREWFIKLSPIILTCTEGHNMMSLVRSPSQGTMWSSTGQPLFLLSNSLLLFFAAVVHQTFPHNPHGQGRPQHELCQITVTGDCVKQYKATTLSAQELVASALCSCDSSNLPCPLTHHPDHFSHPLKKLLTIPCVKLKNVGTQSFHNQIPLVWNSLLPKITFLHLCHLLCLNWKQISCSLPFHEIICSSCVQTFSKLNFVLPERMKDSWLSWCIFQCTRFWECLSFLACIHCVELVFCLFVCCINGYIQHLFVCLLHLWLCTAP